MGGSPVPRIARINSQDEIEEANEEEIDCLTLKGSSKRLKHGVIRENKT